jgi:hypothetical protein
MVWSVLREWTQSNAIVFNHREMSGPGPFRRERQYRDGGRLLGRRKGDAKKHYASGRIRAEAEGKLAEVLVECEQDPVLILPTFENFVVGRTRRVLMHPRDVMPRSTKRDDCNCRGKFSLASSRIGTHHAESG